MKKSKTTSLNLKTNSRKNNEDVQESINVIDDSSIEGKTVNDFESVCDSNSLIFQMYSEENEFLFI